MKGIQTPLTLSFGFKLGLAQELGNQLLLILFPLLTPLPCIALLPRIYN